MHKELKAKNMSQGDKDRIKFDVNIPDHGLVTVECRVIHDIGTYWDPPYSVVEDHVVTKNWRDITDELGEYEDNSKVWAIIDQAAYEAYEHLKYKDYEEYCDES